MSILQELLDDYQRADALVNLLIDRATGASPSEEEFQELRRYFVDSPEFADLLPSWFASKRSLNQFWNHFKNRHSTYAERREYLWREFSPLLTRLESQQARKIINENPVTSLPTFEGGQTLTAAQLNAVVQRVSTIASRRQNDTDLHRVLPLRFFRNGRFSATTVLYSR